MRKYLIYLFFFSSVAVSLAGNEHPLRLENAGVYDGGKLLVQNDLQSGSRNFLFFKPFWADGSESIYKWTSLNRENSLGKSLGEYSIINGLENNGAVCLALKSGDENKYAEFDANLNIKNFVELSNTAFFEKNCLMKVFDANSGRILLFENSLFKISNNQANLISNNIFDIAKFDIDDNFAVYIAKNIENACVYFLKKNTAESIFLAKLPFSEHFRIKIIGSKIFIKGYNENSAYTSIYLLEKDKAIIKNMWLPTKADNIDAFESSGKIAIASLAREKDEITLDIIDLMTGVKIHSLRKFSSLYEPLGISIQNNNLYAVFRNGIAIIDGSGAVQAINALSISDYFSSMPDLEISNDLLILTSLENSFCIKTTQNKLWFFYKIVYSLEKYFYPLITLSLLFFVFQLYKRQRRLLHAVLDLPSSGLMFVINEKKRLIKSNISANKAFNIEPNEKIGKLYDYYYVNQHSGDLKDFIKTCFERQVKQAKKITLSSDSSEKEWLFSAIPLRGSFSKFRGFVFAGVDITEALERKRLANWAQLAHDMQTNLSAIKLNTEQIESTIGSANFERKTKILRQANILIHRVRDIVTVGRGGDALDKSLEIAGEICRLTAQEFDESVFPLVKFEVDAQEFSLYCDKAKLVRAIRNAVENGIKALPNTAGIIRIKARKDERNAYFSIIDNGEGMDSERIDKMLQPYYSGSKNKGGFGIGSMIIQRVIELHGGELKVSSKLGEGAEITIVIPLK